MTWPGFVRFAFATLVVLNVFALTAAKADEEEDETSFRSEFSESVADGRMQITGDEIKYNRKLKAFFASGNVILVIKGQNSKLEANKVTYDQITEIIDARGHVRITRNGQVTTGSAFKFRIGSPQYLVTKQGAQVTDPMGLVVTGRFFENPPTQSIQSFAKVRRKLYSAPQIYQGGYGNGAGYEEGSKTGDFGSSWLFFTPGKGLTKHRELDR